jgi:hypothetical protein
LKNYKLLGIGQTPTELIQAGGETLHSKIHKLINYILNKEKVPENCEEYKFTNRTIKLIVIIIKAYWC